MYFRGIRHRLPEAGIVLLACVFIFRKLGTFPAAWEDDSLFMIVARGIAEGRGYAMPVLDWYWYFPYMLAVGPTVILPSALAIHLFGFSVTIARLPMTLYLIGAVVLMYVWTKRIAGQWGARWATLLLVTLSAFINTGKPVLGEVPAFCFFLSACLILFRPATTVRSVIAGALLGIAVMTKLSYGLIYPAIGIALLFTLLRRMWPEAKHAVLVGVMAVVVWLPWKLLETSQSSGFLGEMRQYGFAEDGNNLLRLLLETPEQLLRFQYIYFGVLLLFALVGAFVLRSRIPRFVYVFLWSFIFLTILYFLNGLGWYRHLLAAHLLLLPFVPVGVQKVVGRRFAGILLAVFVLLQFWWQFTYRGSSLNTEAAEAAQIFEEQYSNSRIVVRQPSIYVRLPHRENWLFLSGEFDHLQYATFDTLPLKEDEHCLPIFRRVSDMEREQFGDRVEDVHRRYVIVHPPASCEQTQ